MVMAPPACRRGAGWVLARPLRQPPPGTSTTPHKPARKGPSPPSRIVRHSSASSSFVLTATRLRALQLDSSHTAARTRAAARKIPKNSQAQPGRDRHVTGPGFHTLLTTVALMGAAARLLAAPVGSGAFSGCSAPRDLAVKLGWPGDYESFGRLTAGDGEAVRTVEGTEHDAACRRRP